MPARQDYRVGGFTSSGARAVNGQRVTITTHADIERDRPGETLGPGYVLYLGRFYLMLFADRPAVDEELPAPDHIVQLADVASVEITPEGEGS